MRKHPQSNFEFTSLGDSVSEKTWNLLLCYTGLLSLWLVLICAVSSLACLIDCCCCFWTIQVTSSCIPSFVCVFAC